MIQASIIGSSPAACAAVMALRRTGIDVRFDVGDCAGSSPPLVLEESTVALLVDLCEGNEIFRDAHQLRRRVVCWGEEEPRLIDQPALSIRGDQLRKGLSQLVLSRVAGSHQAKMGQESDWTVFTSDHSEEDSRRKRFGRRVTLITEVEVCRGTDLATCWIESNSGGWVFFAPISSNRATLQATVPVRPESLEDSLNDILAGTRHIRRMAGDRVHPVDVTISSPAICTPCGEDGRLAAGRAAMCLDPLCGDGTGQALRTGLLAAAVITGVVEGGQCDALVKHFNQRLGMTFSVHLIACAEFYRYDIFSQSWNEEIGSIAAAANTAKQRFEEPLSFRMNGLRLVAIG